mgnify:CR=1 FL=1|jgi:arylsulfatase A-like enzyme
MPQNILFIVIDSLRADQIYNKDKTSVTPNFDKLINSGVYFEQAISSSDATLLNWASMFTGKYAFKTGIRSTKFNKLNKNHKTLFDILKKLDYHFYGYLPELGELVGMFPDFENSDSSYGKLSLDDGLGEKIINQLSIQKMNKPWFFYIHLEELHFPISVPSSFNSKKFGVNNYEREISFIDYWIGRIVEKINLEETLVVITSDHGCYIPSAKVNDIVINLEEKPKLQKIARMTHSNLPKFFEPLKKHVFLILEKLHKQRKRNSIKNLNLEPFQKRNLLWQRSDLDKFLFEENIHVPLFLIGKGIMNPKKISQLVRTIDISPTLIDLIGCQNLFDTDGRSVKLLIDGMTVDDLPAFIESTPFGQLHSNDVIGIRTSKFKYFRDNNNSEKRVHLFDLEIDPFENKNIASSNPKIILELESKINEILNQSSQNGPKINDTKKNDDESKLIEDELKKLGYM